MKIFQKDDGCRMLRVSKSEIKSISKKAGWTDLFDEGYEEDAYADVDIDEYSVENLLQEMEEEDIERQLTDIEEDVEEDVDTERDYVAKCEEAMENLSPLMEDLSRGEFVDTDSVVNDLFDAISPLVEEDVDISEPLSVVREFAIAPVSPEDEELKNGIRMILKKADIPLKDSEEMSMEPAIKTNPSTTASKKKAPLGFYQSSDLWYGILKNK